MKRYLVYALLLVSQLLISQITGVVQSDDDEPLPFSSIILFNYTDTTISKAVFTDTSGLFSLPFISGDTSNYFLKIQTVGYTDWNSPVFSGSKNFDRIQMETNTELDEVQIVVQKKMFKKTARGMVVNVESSPVLSAGTTEDALGKIPGMVVNQDGSFSLKGKHNITIYMDGKPTLMNQRDLALFLKNTPASEIEKIEVFETPPVKFAAAGNAGIINIVRKKGTNLGFNGTVSLYTGYGNYHKLVPSVYGNYRTKKINIYGSGWYYNNKVNHFGTSDMFMIIDGTESGFYNSRERRSHFVGQGERVGADYSINDKTTVGYLGILYSGGFRGIAPSTVIVSGPAVSNYDLLTADADFYCYWSGNTHNFNFIRDISEGESLSFDMDYVDRRNGNDITTLNQYFKKDTAKTPNFVSQEGITKTKIAVIKIDYEKTVFKYWAMETGAKASWVTTENQFLSYSGTNSDDVILNENASNNFDYDEAIYSSYLVFVKSWEKKWSVDIGARLEHTEAEGYSVTLDSTFIRNYTNLFPNVAISYSIPERYSLRTSITRRVQRPNYNQLNPFLSQTNQFNYHQGNPYLRAEYTDVINLSWGLREKFNFTLSASQTLGKMTNVIDQQEELERQVSSVRNIADFFNYSFNASIPIKVADWWTINTNATIYHNKLKADFHFGNIGYEITSFNLSMQNTITLPKDFKLELSGFYNSDSYWSIYFVEPHYQLDFGVTKNWNNWRFTVSVKDFLNIREGNGGVFQNTIKMPTTFKPESRILIFNISYKLGNQKVKQERKRKTGSEDILNRASD